MDLSYPLRGNPPISGGFGPRESFPLPDGRWTLPFHYGVDWAVPEGTPIYASHDGVVRTSGWDNSSYGGGWWIQVADGDFSTWYLHMRERSPVAQGSQVRRGQLIGYVGSSGASTGPHLHMEVHEAGVAKDPLPYFTKPRPKPEKDEDPMPKRKGTPQYRPPLTGKGEVVIPPGKWTGLHINDKGWIAFLENGSKDMMGTLYANIHINGEFEARFRYYETDTKTGKSRVTGSSVTQRIDGLGNISWPFSLSKKTGNTVRKIAVEVRPRGDKPLRQIAVSMYADYWEK